MSAITRHYVSLPGGALAHYRKAGSGPPMIVLHPSPQNSEAMIPAITAFAETCTVIAIDTPGYGQSDDTLPDAVGPDGAGMDDYARAIVDIIDALGIGDFVLYGAATGAQIAVAVAKLFPSRVILTMLDSNGHFAEVERDRMLEGYFPPVMPQRDGSHLQIVWDMCRSLFTAFPWNSDRPEDTLPYDLFPAAIIHATMLRYLDAGEDYAKAYRPAFYTETRAHLDGLTTPATMMRWEGSPVLPYADALIAQGLPDNFTVLEAGPSLPERYGVQVAAVRDALAGAGSRALPFASEDDPALPTTQRGYLPSPSGQIHARYTAGDGRQLMMLHAAGSSSKAGLRQAQEAIPGRPVLALDLSGHGHSDRYCNSPFPSVEKLARPLIEALQKTDLPDFDLAGAGLGGAVAAQMSAAFPAAQLLLIDPTPLDDAEQADMIAYGLPDLTPGRSGAHLAEAWWLVRDQANYWPHQHGKAQWRRAAPLSRDPADLHARVHDLLRLGGEWREMARLEAQLDWAEVLRGVTQPVTIAITSAHPCSDRAEQLATDCSATLLHTGQ